MAILIKKTAPFQSWTPSPSCYLSPPRCTNSWHSLAIKAREKATQGGTKERTEEYQGEKPETREKPEENGGAQDRKYTQGGRAYWTNAKGRRTKQGRADKNQTQNRRFHRERNRESEQGRAHWTGGTKKTTIKNREGGFSRLKTVTREDNKQKKKTERPRRREEETEELQQTR